MQFRVISGFAVFLGSYLPLALILAAQDIRASWWKRPVCSWAHINTSECGFNPFSHPYLAIIPLCVGLISVVVARQIFNKLVFPFEIVVTSAKSIPNEIINYVFPYVVSFMGIAYDQQEKLVGFAIFLIWLFAITYKSGQIVMNPLLLMLGWSLYEANITINNTSRVVRILKKGQLHIGIQKAQTIQDFYITRD